MISFDGRALKCIFFSYSHILIVGSVLHCAPKAEHLGSDSSKTSIVSTLKMFGQVTGMLHFHMNL